MDFFLGDGTRLQRFNAFPKLIAEVFPSTYPPTVNAATFNDDEKIVYLLHEYIIYEYSADDNTIPYVFTFVQKYDTRHFFSYLLNNPLFMNPPCMIDAMYHHSGDKMLVIFCNNVLYQYDKELDIWTMHGQINTPCVSIG